MSLALVKKPEYEFGDGLFSKWNAIHQQEGVKFEYQRKDFAITGWVDNAGKLKITISSIIGLLAEMFVYLYDDSGIYTPGFYEIDAIDDGTHLTLVLNWNGEGSDGFINSEDKFPNYNVLAEIYTVREDVLGPNLLTNGDFSVWDADDPEYWTVIGESGTNPEISKVGADKGHGGSGTGACNIYSTNDNISMRPSIDILIKGKYYLIEIKITKIVSGSIRFRMGAGGMETFLSTEDIHKYIRVCDGTDIKFFISCATVTCNVTIDNVSVREIGSSKELIFTPDTTGLVKVDSVSVLKMISSFVESSLYDTANIRDDKASGRFKVRVKEQWTGSSEAWSAYSDAFYHTNSARQLQDRFGKNMNEFVLKEKSIDIKKLYYETDELGYPIYVLSDPRISPLLYYYNKKTYGVWMQRPGFGFGIENMVYAIYHEENRISASYGVGPGRPLGSDPHGKPAIIVADDGHIIVAYEQLKNDDPDSGHPSAVEVKRSDNVEDETSWVHAKAKDANYYTTVSTYLSYPKLYKLSNGNIILFARGSTSAVYNEQEMVTLYISTDDGKTFSAGIEVVDLLGSYYAYNYQLTKGITSQIEMQVNRYNESTKKRDEVYYLKSVDGGTTWTDVAGGGSKNVVTSGALTMNDLQDDKYRVCQDLVNGVLGLGGTMIDVNTPYIIVLNGLAVTRPISIYEYSGGIWNEHVTGIDELLCTIDLIYKSINNSFDIIMRDVVSSYYVTRRKNALLSDLTDWTIISDNIFKRPISEFYSLIHGAYTFNQVDAYYHAFGRLIDNSSVYNDFYIYMEVRNVAKFLAKFNTPKRYINYPWDISIIYSELLSDKLITLKEISIDINGNKDSQYWTDLDNDEEKYINRIIPEKKIQPSYAFYDLSILLTGLELLLNGTFDYENWTTEDPDDWTVIGESGSDPEIRQVYPDQRHTRYPGRDACNIYSTANDIYMYPTVAILTIGKTYLVEIEITKATSGSIKFRLGSGDSYTIISTAGIHRYIKTCSGSTQFRIGRDDVTCDITIDNLSIKEYYDEISEVKRIEIDQDCKDNPIYLRWVNLLGAREYWLFSHHQEYGLEIYDINLIERNITNIETAEAIQDIISKEAKESVIIGEDNLLVTNVEGMKGLLLSPLVQMLTNPASWESEGPKWKTVIVKKNTWNLYRNDRGNYSLELEIGLPKLNIQTR